MEKQALEKFQQFCYGSCCCKYVLEYIDFILSPFMNERSMKQNVTFSFLKLPHLRLVGQNNKVCKYFIYKYIYACILICKSVHYMINSRGLSPLQLWKCKRPFNRSPWHDSHILLQNIEYNALIWIRTVDWRYANSRHTKTYWSLAVLTHYYIYKGKIVDWCFCREKGASKAAVCKSNLVDCICRAFHICWCLNRVHFIFKLWYSGWIISFQTTELS